MGERRPCKAEVVGSNPISSTRFESTLGCAVSRRSQALISVAGSLTTESICSDKIRRLIESLKIGQATKGARWMPWRREATKDAASCEKLRGAASRL